MINQLKKIYGHRCTAININGESSDFINIPLKKMKFCEAVKHSFNTSIRINTENLDCPGARRSIGFDNNDPQIERDISMNNSISASFIVNALNNIPKLQGVKHINLGLTEAMENYLTPDLYIIYVQPVVVTGIMYKLAQNSIKPVIPPYSLLSVCGNIFANCYINKVTSISFGCPESRKHGEIDEDEIVLGIPYGITRRLLNSFNVD